MSKNLKNRQRKKIEEQFISLVNYLKANVGADINKIKREAQKCVDASKGISDEARKDFSDMFEEKITQSIQRWKDSERDFLKLYRGKVKQYEDVKLVNPGDKRRLSDILKQADRHKKRADAFYKHYSLVEEMMYDTHVWFNLENVNHLDDMLRAIETRKQQDEEDSEYWDEIDSESELSDSELEDLEKKLGVSTKSSSVSQREEDLEYH